MVSSQCKELSSNIHRSYPKSLRCSTHSPTTAWCTQRHKKKGLCPRQILWESGVRGMGMDSAEGMWVPRAGDGGSTQESYLRWGLKNSGQLLLVVHDLFPAAVALTEAAGFLCTQMLLPNGVGQFWCSF